MLSSFFRSKRIPYDQIFNNPNPKSKSPIRKVPSVLLLYIIQYLDPKAAGCFLLQTCKRSLHTLKQENLLKPYINQLKKPYPQFQYIVQDMGIP